MDAITDADHACAQLLRELRPLLPQILPVDGRTIREVDAALARAFPAPLSQFTVQQHGPITAKG